MNLMSEDAKAILLISGHFGRQSEAEPLNQREYNEVVRWLVVNNLRPADLLPPDHIPLLAKDTSIPQHRLDLLLKRGVQLGFAVEGWQQSGIWVICRSDPEYPTRYKTHLKDKAPPVLFGAGDQALLCGGGLAIVGSRNVDAEGESFAREIADWCGRNNMPVVSGGARGVDSISMTVALDAGGIVIGVLAENLLRKSVARDARHALSDGRLLLISPYHPEAGFSVGNAMGRNKLIYAMADYGLVVSAEHKKGGTWEGAVEELRRSPSRPIFVRALGSTPLGNRKLLELGGIAFPAYAPSDDPATVLKTKKHQLETSMQGDELPLFAPTKSKLSMVREGALSHEMIPYTEPSAPKPDSSSIYKVVLPVLLAALDKPQSIAQLVKQLDVSKGPLEAWLTRAIVDKKICKLSSPVRYARAVQ